MNCVLFEKVERHPNPATPVRDKPTTTLGHVPSELNERCQRTVSSFSDAHPERAFELLVEAGIPPALADPTRVDQIVANLCSDPRQTTVARNGVALPVQPRVQQHRYPFAAPRQSQRSRRSTRLLAIQLHRNNRPIPHPRPRLRHLSRHQPFTRRPIPRHVGLCNSTHLQAFIAKRRLSRRTWLAHHIRNGHSLPTSTPCKHKQAHQ